MSSTITNNKPYAEGSLFQKKADSANDIVRIYKLPHDAIELIKIEPFKETYQHHIVSNAFLDLTGAEYLFLLHFFTDPHYIQYYPNATKVANKNKQYKCIAYFLHDNSIWASEVYASVSNFEADYSIIA